MIYIMIYLYLDLFARVMDCTSRRINVLYNYIYMCVCVRACVCICVVCSVRYLCIHYATPTG